MDKYNPEQIYLFCSNDIGNSKEEVVHCPFEGQADMHNKIQPDWLNQLCQGQIFCRKSRNLSGAFFGGFGAEF